MKRLYFSVTKRCNLRCAHCFNNSGDDESHELTTDQVYSVIKSARADLFTEVQLTGGEALIREDIFDIISFVHSCGMSVLIQTNGLIDDISMRRLLELDSECTGFVVSIDGIETNDMFRGASVTESALRTVETLSSRFPVRINTLLSAKINNSEIEHLLSLVGKSGATIAFNPIIPCGRGVLTDMVEPTQYFEKMVWLEKQDFKIRKNFSYDSQAKLFYDKENCPVRKKKGIFIAANGDCYPCGFLDGIKNMFLGNVLEYSNGFSELLANYPAICADISDECTVCDYYINENCFGGCPARIYALHKNFKGCEFYCMKKYGREWMSNDYQISRKDGVERD
ncbi:MAG: radical SAM protein [Defluviitaleaceae bacterium]|nr:radical SAM protein [Defluviitaleaceae bacterium]